jgi:histidine triad (HIT) family protein
MFSSFPFLTTLQSAMDCIFCRIVERSAPAELLFENETAIGILDRSPIHFGHALIIPKDHCQTFLDLPAGSMPGIMEATSRVSNALVSTLHLEGFNIFSNNGKVAGQSIFHFHWHITPRYANDNIRFELKLKQYPDGQMAEYAQRIREYIHSTV